MRTKFQLSPPALDIPADEPFRNDKLERRDFANTLTSLLKRIEGPTVIVLDAPWGAGKTKFVQMWSANLKNEKFPVIYFDAFKNDYQEDGFIALAGEVYTFAKEFLATNEEHQKELTKYITTAARLGKIILPKIAGAATKTLIGVSIDPETYGDFLAKFAEECGNITASISASEAENFIKSKLEKHHEEQSVIQTFTADLSALVSSFYTAQKIHEDQRFPLIFIIDELDRCRPLFALSLLEKIKHAFSAENVIFFLVTNLKQLETSVKLSYGSDIDATMYLEKFYHLRVSLPNKAGDESVACTYIDHLFKNWIKVGGENFTRTLKEEMLRIARAQSPSLRSLERLAGYALLICLSIPEGEADQPNPALLADLCALRVLARELYLEVTTPGCTNSRTYNKIATFFGYNANSAVEPADSALDSENMWRYLLHCSIDSDKALSFGITFRHLHARHVCPEHAKYIDIFSFPRE